MKKPLAILTFIFIFTFVNFGCCNETTRKNALYSNPKNLIQKIVNYVIENGEQSCSLSESVYEATTVDEPLFIEEATVVVKRKKKDFFIHGAIYREDGAKREEFDLYNYGADFKLDLYYGVKYDENGNKTEELLRDFNKNKECLNGVCETKPPEYFANHQLYYYRYYLAWMADDLGIE